MSIPRKATYGLAHTARCKLQLAADRPDRNLRFILGHAFTLDNLRLRIAEIETDTSIPLIDSDSDDDLPTCSASHQKQSKPRRVSFTGGSPRPQTVSRPKSPPPNELAQLSSSESESESDDDAEEDDEFEEELSLQRFASATAKAPRMVADDGEDDDDDIGPKSPEMGPSEGDLRIVTGGEGDAELAEAYNHVNGCPCHGQKGPGVEKVWEIPGKKGENGGQLAVIQIAA